MTNLLFSRLPKDKDCSGCGTCSAACPYSAISMRKDTEGFFYPEVDFELCVGCNICVKRCPAISKHCYIDRLSKTNIGIYAAWHKNENIRRDSSSGGIFTALATSILDSSGVVFGAYFEPPCRTCHTWVDCVDDLKKLRGSKYVQSEIGQSYAEVKLFLDKGRPVLFVGSPCQVAGLYSYLGSDHPALITADFVCHGVASIKLLHAELEYRLGDKISEISTVSFRDKRDGWRLSYWLVIDTIDGDIVALNYRKSPFHIGFLSGICLRPSCYSCRYKGVPRIADISLGDFREFSRVNKSLDDNKGTSLVLTNSKKGKQLFISIKDRINAYLCPFDYIIDNRALMESVSPHRQRTEFFRNLDVMPYSQLVRKYLSFPNVLQRGIAKTFRLCRKTLTINRYPFHKPRYDEKKQGGYFDVE